MEWLSKVIDLIKAGGWQLLMIAAAASAFLFLDQQGILPGVTDTWRLAAWALMLASGFLAVAPALSALQMWAGRQIERGRLAKQKQAMQDALTKRFTEYLPYMTEKERAILGYLLKNKQKHFTADQDAGYGAGLMAMSFIVRIGVAGQAFDFDKIPMGVPDAVWKVMEAHPEKFEYQPEYSGDRGNKREVPPWRIPWGAR